MNGYSHDLLEKPLPKGVPFEDYKPPNWDEFFMLKVYLTGEIQMKLFIEENYFDFLAQKSKDPRTKIGAVLVRDRRDLISGYNGLPEGS
jgi:deoxycytidylate deaminase